MPVLRSFHACETPRDGNSMPSTVGALYLSRCGAVNARVQSPGAAISAAISMALPCCVGCGIVKQPPELGVLRLHQVSCVEPGGGAGPKMELLDRIVVAGDRLQLPIRADLHVVLARVANKVLEGSVRVLPEHPVI